MSRTRTPIARQSIQATRNAGLRADVADFLVKQIGDDVFLHKTPVLTRLTQTLQPPGLLFADEIAGYSECLANPLMGLSIEFHCFFRMSIEISSKIGGFDSAIPRVRSAAHSECSFPPRLRIVDSHKFTALYPSRARFSHRLQSRASGNARGSCRRRS